MKNVLIILSLTFSQVLWGQKAPKVTTINIQTTAECGDCKERIEGKLNYTKGVIFADLDLETKQVEVKYKTKKIDATEIKQVIADLGYDADELPANKEAYEQLPACCKIGGMRQ